MMNRFMRALAVVLVLLVGAAIAVATEEPAGPTTVGPTEITYWTTESQPARMVVQERIAADFEAQTGITVNVVPVEENELGERATAAFSAGELPDVIYHPLNFTLSWAEAGILDAVAATEVVDSLGASTYGTGVLNLVEVDDGYAAVPVDGWTQLLVYRTDLFEAAGLAPPTDYDSILAAVEALHNPPELYGFVAATDPSQVYMMQVFEHLALANGVDIVNDAGDVVLNTAAMRETLEFYKEIADASPPGNLFWQQSRELYFAGQTAMIVWSPFIMDELAGLRDSVPVTALNDPTGDELAKNTAFVTRVAGPSNPGGSGWTDVRYFGITVDAETAAAQAFVEFSMAAGYIDTLAVAPEGKFPVRQGTVNNPTLFVDGWADLEVGVDRKAALGSIYPQSVIDGLVEGLETGSRWGFDRGFGALTARLYDTRVIAEIVREYLDDEITVDEALAQIQSETEALAE